MYEDTECLLKIKFKDMLAKGEAFSEAQKHVNESMQLGFHIGNLGTLDSNEEDIKSSLGEFSKICEEFRSGFKKMLGQFSEVKSLISTFDETTFKKEYKDSKKAYSKASEKYYSAMQVSYF